MAYTSRSLPARQAILGAARSVFAAEGFDRTTIRAVAALAGTDPAMVMRYYVNKEGLFAAAVDVDLSLPPTTDPVDWGAALGEHFVASWEGPGADGTLQILLRSAGGSPAVADRVREIFAEQVVIAVAAGRQESAASSALRAGRIATYVLGTALCRYVLRLPPMADWDGPTLAHQLGSVIQGFLDDKPAAITRTAVPASPGTP